MKKKYSCLFFAEGKRDKNFLYALIELKKFKYYVSDAWHIEVDNASGCSARTILEQCKKRIIGYDYQLVMCFIDLDDLKHDFKVGWQKEKIKLEAEFGYIKIVWQEDNAEDEYKKVLGGEFRGKNHINKQAKERIDEFINSDYWDKIINPIKNREAELNKEKK